MNIELEKQRRISTQDIYDIISFAVDAAEDNGFINSFILERALYEFAAIIVFPERKEEIASLVAENINTAWDVLLDDGTIDILYDDYKVEMEMLAGNARIWVEDFSTYLHSARGLLNSFQETSGNIVDQAVRALKQSAEESGVEEILDIADKWGMNRESIKESKKLTVINGGAEDSLFVED